MVAVLEAGGIINVARTQGNAMTIEIYRPDSRGDWLKGRSRNVGASELPTLFGVSPYSTPFEFFAMKTGQYKRGFPEAVITEWSISIPPTEQGNLTEGDSAALIRRLRPQWIVELNQIPGGVIYVDKDARIASTPDCFAYYGDGRRACIQIKSVSPHIFKDEWMIDGIVTVPVSVAIQTIADASLSGCDEAYAAALVVDRGMTLYLEPVPIHSQIMMKSRELVADFWRRVEENDPYPPDFARDGAVIASIYRDSDDSEIDLSRDERMAEIMLLREPLKVREADGNAAEKDRKILDAEIIFRLGNAERGRLADGRLITAKTVRRRAYNVDASQYRTIKLEKLK